MKLNQKVKIVLDSFDGKEYEGIVSNISLTPKAGESGSVYSVKVNFVNVDFVNSQFRVAMTGDAKFVVSEKDNVLYLPSNFLKQDKSGKYLKTDSKKGKVYVEAGIESEDSVEVIGNINEGQTVYD